jgi:hypothetical protein
MSNSIYLAGRDLEFIKAMLHHMKPTSKSLVTIMETNHYENKIKAANYIKDDHHDDMTY